MFTFLKPSSHQTSLLYDLIVAFPSSANFVSELVVYLASFNSK